MSFPMPLGTFGSLDDAVTSASQNGLSENARAEAKSSVNRSRYQNDVEDYGREPRG
jgi:hypothetical protein